jgi:putative tributyrin esterase
VVAARDADPMNLRQLERGLPVFSRFVCSSLAIALCAVLASGQGAPTVPVGTVQSHTMWSQALGVRKDVVVYLPPSYATDAAAGRRYPVAVFLHGVWGSERDWTARGALATTMDSLIATGMSEMVIVMPDGDNGWWTTWNGLIDLPACRRTPRQENADTFCVPWAKYDDYVVHDVVAFADSAFRTLATRETRAVAGLGMGGYGAISIAARAPETFSVAASHSGFLRPALMTDSSSLVATGTVRMRDASTRDELRMLSGARWELMAPAFGTDSISWMARDPVRLIERLLARGAKPPALFADVGSADAVLPMNRAFRDQMARLHVPLQYAEWSGRNDWTYWRAHLPESLQFIAARIARR